MVHTIWICGSSVQRVPETCRNPRGLGWFASCCFSEGPACFYSHCPALLRTAGFLLGATLEENGFLTLLPSSRSPRAGGGS